MFSALRFFLMRLHCIHLFKGLLFQEQHFHVPNYQVGALHRMSYEPASRNGRSLLLDLPLELRLRIYEFCFPFQRVDLTVLDWDGPIIMDACCQPVQLLRTCRAIRIEAEPVLRRNTIFVGETQIITPYPQSPIVMQHLEIEMDRHDVDYFCDLERSVPPRVKTLQLIYRSYDDYYIDAAWNKLRREAVKLFADSASFNVLEDFSESGEVVFGMRYEKDLSQLKNRGEIIMLKPDIGTYHGTVS